jgi:xylulokinase
MSDHLIEEPKLDVGVLRQAVQEEYAEGPAFGAALLAGVAAGAYGSVEEATSVVELREEVTEPDPERSKAYEELYGTYHSLYPATKKTMSRLTDLATRS